MRDDGCFEEHLDGEIVLYSATSSQAIYLNESASLIWQLIDKKNTVENIISLLSEAYPEVIDLKYDVLSTLDKLFQHGIIRLI